MNTFYPSCWDTIKGGIGMGFMTGLAIGFLTGVLGGISGGHRGRELLRYVGKTSAVSGGSFSVFMGVGGAIRGGRCI